MLTPEILDRAESAASRPFDRERVVARTREMGVPVQSDRADAPARELLARLRSGAELDARLVGLLSEQLAAHPEERMPEALVDVAGWVGASERERGNALRDVLRLYGAIAQTRDPVRAPEPRRFPRFASRPESGAP